MEKSIKEINELVKQESLFVSEVMNELGKTIVGQRYLLERLLIGMLADGHVLLEGVPGLAKTLAVKTLAQSVDCKFSRIQFTPDLLPGDIIGTMVFSPKTSDFYVKKGPIFANLILADEINRAPAKVQSALLEAMQERQVSIGDKTYLLDEPFMVLATQNPIEQEGTYPLPEAQVDRFMLKLKITYPDKKEEKEIMEKVSSNSFEGVKKVINSERIKKARESVRMVYMDEKIKDYIVNIVLATRNPEEYKIKDLKNMILYGASPRASIYLAETARAYAFISGRGYITPEDVKNVAMDVLRHRIILTYEAEADNITSEDIVKRLLLEVEVP
ncbi:MAG: AAA family ATPase [Elusimicrobia bacterium]|nr:AAA family ATPase [Elusimicrobiota bacterium]